MFSVLGLGFLIGMRHAMEADHAAAVATLATKSQSVANTVRQGLTWGLGHTITLLLFGSMVFLLEAAVPEKLATWIELAVGVMLVGLGCDVLRKFAKSGIHVHVHQHPHQSPHVHVHSHQAESDHRTTDHHHTHSTAFPYRALFVGLMHGMAGSAALILLTLQQTVTPLQGITYIASFGLGSILGMATLSMVIAIPLRYSSRSISWLHNGLQGSIGAITIALGLMLIYTTGSFLLS
jgi:ABC-type nickel/cobalt efflux system permease component RcnA